jgi:hypothetical protein
MDHKQILKTASDILAQRGKQYGEVSDHFNRISQIATALLGKQVTPYDVVMIFHCTKLTRMQESPSDIDHYVDGVNYLAFAGQFATKETKQMDAENF